MIAAEKRCYRCKKESVEEGATFRSILTGPVVVYHAFHDDLDAYNALTYGVSGKDRPDRRYSYEADNNPRGLFVSQSVERASEFGRYVIEFTADAHELAAPTWPGGSYTVQGQMSQSFFGDLKKRLQARRKYTAKDLDLMFNVSREKQALFVGNLAPNRITAIHVFSNIYGEAPHVYSPSDFKKEHEEEILRSHQRRDFSGGVGLSDPESGIDPRRRIFGPQEPFSSEKLLQHIKTKYQMDPKEAVAMLQDRSGGKWAIKNLLWPKQVPAYQRWLRSFGLEEAVLNESLRRDCWVKPDGERVFVPEQEHAYYILEHPEDLGMTKESLDQKIQGAVGTPEEDEVLYNLAFDKRWVRVSCVGGRRYSLICKNLRASKTQIEDWATAELTDLPDHRDYPVTLYESSSYGERSGTLMTVASSEIFESFRSIIEAKLGVTDKHYADAAALAQRILQVNAKNLDPDDVDESESEWAVTIYLKNGKVQATNAVFGEQSEVEFPKVPSGGIPLANVHTHPYSDPELSKWDVEAGQEMADETGHDFIMYVIGWDDDGELTMTDETFEPRVRESFRSIIEALLER